jgi:hypothetical protein
MIDVSEVVADVDLQAPQPFTILRSIQAEFVAGGFTDQKIEIPDVGPVQPATDLDAQMVPEADRLSQLFAFWATQPIFTTRGKAPVLTTHGEVPEGTLPGSVFVLSSLPPNGNINLFYDGLLQEPGVDYTISGQTVTLMFTAKDPLYVTWPAIQQVGINAADIIVYPPKGEQYRVLAVKHYPGSGYFKAIGTRMNAT